MAYSCYNIGGADPCSSEEELKTKIGNAKFHHCATIRGYVSRKVFCEVEDYSGRFGRGFRVYYPNWRSTMYCFCDYYINKED